MHCAHWTPSKWRAGRWPLTDLAAVHDEAAAGQLVGKTVLIL
jgi:hypothetical protein